MSKTEQFVMRLPKEEKQQLKSLSQLQDKSVSMIIRESYRHTLNTYSEKQSELSK